MIRKKDSIPLDCLERNERKRERAHVLRVTSSVVYGIGSNLVLAKKRNGV